MRVRLKETWHQLDMAVVVGTFVRPAFAGDRGSIGFGVCTLVRQYHDVNEE